MYVTRQPNTDEKECLIMSVFCNSRVKKKQIFAILKRTLFQIFQTLLKLL